MESGREDEEDGEMEPCSPAARAEGCSCTWSTVWSNDVDPPHTVVDSNCPVHGRDPDEAYERLRERREEDC